MYEKISEPAVKLFIDRQRKLNYCGLQSLKFEISIDDKLNEKVLRELEDEIVDKVYSKDMPHSAHARDIIDKVNVEKEK